MARALVFSVITLGIFLSSSLAGQVMVEKARRDSIRAMDRARAAVKEEGLLRDQLEEMTRASAVEGWAAANGMIGLEKLAAEQEQDHAEAVH